MILSIHEYQHSSFRGFNFLLSSLSPQHAKTQSEQAHSSFQEALMSIHGNEDATLPFAAFDKQSCELKVAKFRAEKKIKDRLLPQPRYFCLCYFPQSRGLYVNLPNWMRIYLLSRTGEIKEAIKDAAETAPGEEWSRISVTPDTLGLSLSIFEDPSNRIENWARLLNLPKQGCLLRVSQFLESPPLGEDGRNYMPVWTMNFG